MTDLSNLTDEQRQLLAALLSEEDSALGNESIPKRTFPDHAPLSSAQQRMWLAYRQSPEDPSYNIQTAMRIGGNLDKETLRKALELLVARHETLRTSFAMQELDPIQIIHAPAPLIMQELEIYDPQALRQYVADQALKPWDLSQTQSLRVTFINCAPNEYVLLLGMHHILSDGWSVGVLYRELWQMYESLLSSGQSVLPELKINYADYAQWEQSVQSQTDHTELTFWRKKLADANDEVSLPLDKDRTSVASGQAAIIYSWDLPDDLVDLVHRQAQSNRCSTFAVCLAGFYLMLGELTGQRDLLVASPVANRDRAELEALIGYFANTVVLRAEWTRKTNFNELVRQVHDYSLEVFEHQGFPFEQVVEDLNPKRISGINPLTQIFFAFQKYALDDTKFSNIQITEFEHGTRSTRFDLECHIWETAQKGISATFIYPQFIEDSTIKKWAQRWSTLLVQACTQPLVPVVHWTDNENSAAQLIKIKDEYLTLEEAVIALPSIDQAHVHVAPKRVEISYLSPEELYPQDQNIEIVVDKTEHVIAPKSRSPLPALITGGPINYDQLPAQTLPHLLIQAAERAPDSGCLFLPSEVHVSYSAILSRARKIQTFLQQSGVKLGDKIVFQLDSEQEVIQYLWGAVFAGVVPMIQPIATLGQEQAAEPILAIWRLFDKPLVLVTNKTEVFWKAHLASYINTQLIDFDSVSEAEQPHSGDPDDIALFAHSSGSTGHPKGIPLSHRNLLVRAYAARDFTKIDRLSVMLNWMPLNHHAPVSDWHLRGVAAASNLIYANNSYVLAEPVRWLDWLERFHVSDTWAPNFAYSLIIETLEQEQYARRRWDLSKLKICLCAGEAIVSDIMDKFEDMLSSSNLAIGVLQPAYGLTETASGITYHQPKPGMRITRYQIEGEHYPLVGCGIPIAGVSIRIVNEQVELLQQNEVGYVHLHGECIFKSYFEINDLNRERFKPDGWFDSGDLGFIYDGQLFITGRSKAEIIVNGRNLSCEALEISIGSLEEIRIGKVAVCTVRPKGASQEQIAIFFVPTADKIDQETLRKLKGHVVQQFGIFPDYLIPLDSEALPRTDLGKIRHIVLSKQFAEGVFDPILASQKASSAMIPDSFYRRVWQRAPLSLSQGKTLNFHVLSQRSEFSVSLANALLQDGQQIQQIDIGESLTKDVFAQDVMHLVDLSPYESSNDTQDVERPYAVMEHLRHLLQNLAALAPKHCYLTVITCQSQSTGREKNLRYDDAVVAGMLKSANQELSGWLHCRHIDLEQGNNLVQAQLLAEELQAQEFSREVAYRAHRRLIPQIKKVILNRDLSHQHTTFDRKGFIVVSGGMGGIGRELAKRLQSQYGFQLLLLGRSTLDEEATKFLAEHPGCAYAQVDVSDGKSLERVVVEYENRWHKPMSGVIHLAGCGSWQEHAQHIEEEQIVNLNAGAWDEQFKAKINGTHQLFELVRARPDTRFVVASSLLGIFGGRNFSVYSAANSFLYAFCEAQHQEGYALVNCLHWGPWQDIGMSRGQRPEQAMLAGYLSLETDAAWHIFIASLLNNQHDLMIGLDPQHANAGQTKSVTVFYTSNQPDLATQDLSVLARRVRFETNSMLEFRHVSAIPADAKALLEESAVDPGTPEQKKIEEILSLIFEQALRLKKIPVDDNFFELGAHSLLLATLEARIKKEVSDRLELLDLFRFPTIRQLSRYLAGSNDASQTSLVNQRRVKSADRSELRLARSKHRKSLS